LATKLNVGLRVPSLHPVDTGRLKAFVQEADALGFHSIWVGDHVFHHVDVLQPLELLSWIAGLTEHVRLGTAVMLTAYLNPVLLAKAAASLDQLSGGRLTLGVSLGGTPAEYASIGVPMEQRLGRLLESVAVMRKLWQEEDVAYAGRYYQVEGGNIRPKPVQPGGVPLCFGATSEAMMRRIARVADGWVANGASPIEDFVAGIKLIRDEATARGRDPDSLIFAKLHGVSLHADKATARAMAERQWQSYYSPRFNVDATTIYGTPAECREKLQAFAAADAPEVTLILEPSNLELDQLRLLREATANL